MITDEEARLARKRERRKARRLARKEVRAEAKNQGVVLPSRRNYTGPILAPVDFMNAVISKLGLQPTETGDSYWLAYSLRTLQETYPDPAEAADFIRLRMKALGVSGEHCAVIPGRIIGVGPVTPSWGR